jgi:transporter family protein
MDYVKYAFIALVGWGIWAIGSKMLTRQFDAVSTAFWISLWSFSCLLVYILLKRQVEINIQVLYALPVGIVSMIAILAFYEALKRGPTSVVLPLTNMYILFPVIFGYIALQERMTASRIIGVVFAVLATIFLSR